MVNAIILAAGRGSRMGSLTEDKPKALTLLRGIPLIDRQIKALRTAGIEKIFIVTGYKAEQLNNRGDSRIHNPRWDETNMVSSLMCAKDTLIGSDCIVAYSDIFYHPSIISALIECGDNLCISYDPNWLNLWARRFENPLDDAETLRLDNAGYVLEIGKVASKVEEIQGQYMGLLKFKHAFWNNTLPEISNSISMTNYLYNLIDLKIPIKAIKNTEAWGEIDSESDLEVFENMLDIQ